MALTLFALHNAKPRETPYKLSDGNGLHLLVQPNGSKLWRFRYRFGGKENMLTFGAFPEVMLAEARGRRDEARKLLSAGVDPAEQRKLQKLAAETAKRTTFGAIALEYIAKVEAEGAAPATLDKKRWLLLDLAASLKNRPITAITPAEILLLLKRIEARGNRHTAHRLRGVIGTVFRLAVATLRATNDPTYALRGALLKENREHLPAITDEVRFGQLLRDIESYQGWPPIKAALKFQALTMSRPGDVRALKRAEINFPKAVWRIPAERMKMRRPHDVPLSRQALAVLQEVWPYSEGSELVFPAQESRKKRISENGLNSALRTLGYLSEEVCSHGFRTSASTFLNERGFSPDVIEACLAHEEEDEVRRAYNRARYWTQRVELMQTWADLMDELQRDKPIVRTLSAS
jgi:integrase